MVTGRPVVGVSALDALAAAAFERLAVSACAHRRLDGCGSRRGFRGCLRGVRRGRRRAGPQAPWPIRKSMRRKRSGLAGWTSSTRPHPTAPVCTRPRRPFPGSSRATAPSRYASVARRRPRRGRAAAGARRRATGPSPGRERRPTLRTISSRSTSAGPTPSAAAADDRHGRRRTAGRACRPRRRPGDRRGLLQQPDDPRLVRGGARAAGRLQGLRHSHRRSTPSPASPPSGRCSTRCTSTTWPCIRPGAARGLGTAPARGRDGRGLGMGVRRATLEVRRSNLRRAAPVRGRGLSGRRACERATTRSRSRTRWFSARQLNPRSQGGRVRPMKVGGLQRPDLGRRQARWLRHRT